MGINRNIEVALSNKFANMAILCAALVVIIHCRPCFEPGTGAWWVKQMVEEGICLIAVPFFFTASGFFLAGRIGENEWYRRAIVKRMRTLVVPFVLWNIMFILFSAGLDGHFPSSIESWIDYLGLHPSRFPALSPLWYVRALCVLVLLSPLLNKFANIRGESTINFEFPLRVSAGRRWQKR